MAQQTVYRDLFILLRAVASTYSKSIPQRLACSQDHEERT